MAKKIQRSNMTATDDKGRILRAPAQETDLGKASFKWWKLDEQEIPAAVIATVKEIQLQQSSREERLREATIMSGNTAYYSVLGGALGRSIANRSNSTTPRMSFNVIQSCQDTLTAKMAKNKVIPTYVTNGGIWKYQKKAKQLSKFAQGLGYQLGLHEICINGFSDCSTWGDAFTHPYNRFGKVAIDRVYPQDLLVDVVESTVQEPSQLHWTPVRDRDFLLEMYPELEEFIMRAMAIDSEKLGAHKTVADLVQVIHSYHLPSGPDAKDGMHVITIGDGCIIEPWDKTYYPFPHLRYCRDRVGWFSKGIPERLGLIQGEISRNMILKQSSMRMQGSFKVLIENGSKVVAQHLNNDVGALIFYSGVKPEYVTPPATNPELQQYIDSLIMKAYQQEGVSQLSAAAEKPLGVDSGKAMRTLTDIEDDRFTFVAQGVEQFVLDNVKIAIDVVKEIYKDKKSYEVVFPTTNFLETVDWKDINLEDDCYVLKAFPTSQLATDISGRLSDVQELAQAGMISPRTAKRLMNMPDVEMEESLSNASEDYLHKTLEAMIYDEEYTAPTPFMDLQLAQQLVLEYYNYSSYMNAPDSVLELLEQFNAQLKDLTGVTQQATLANQALAQQQAMAQQQAGQPSANPAPTPVSNLIPNVNGAQAA